MKKARNSLIFLVKKLENIGLGTKLIGSFFVCIILILLAVGLNFYQFDQAQPALADFNWTITQVDTTNDVGQFTSLVLDSANNPRISAYDFTNRDLRYSFCSIASGCDSLVDWTSYTIDFSVNDVGAFSSLALDSANNPRIGYYDATDRDLKFTLCSIASGCDEAGDWTTYIVDATGDSGAFASMALDANDNIGITYRHEEASAIKYAYCSIATGCDQSGDWILGDPGDSGNFSSLAFDLTTGNPRIAHRNAFFGLRYAFCNDQALSGCDQATDWTIYTVDNVGNLNVSLAMDSTQSPRIAYWHSPDNTLRFASCPIVSGCDEAGDWTITIADEVAGNSVGQYASLILDSNDNPFISHYNQTIGDLRLSSCLISSGCDAPGDWNSENVDTGGDVGLYTSIQVNADEPRISYYDVSNGDLKYAQTVNNPPDAPILVSPLNAATVISLTPQLYALYSDSDADDTGQVEFRVSSGSAADCLNNVNIVSSGASAESSTNLGPQFFTTDPLTNLATYNWCARNNDGTNTSAYADMGSFTVDTTVAAGLVYSSYLGGSSGEQVDDIIVDTAGNAYVTGHTFSANFPTTTGAFDTSSNGDIDVFVSKIDANGDVLIYSTYLGGSNSEQETSQTNGLAVDSSNNVYITGSTESADFPTQNPFQAANAGGFDAFVTKLSADGSSLIYSTFLGGSDVDNGFGIVVDISNQAYVTGETISNDFPTQNPFQANNAGFRNVFITKFSADGSSLDYSTYLGGSNSESGFDIALDSSNNAYVTGRAESVDFPTQNPFQAVKGAGVDVFITKLSSTGMSLVYSTYLGGSSQDVGNGIVVDSSNNAYITGETSSLDFPTQNPYQAVGTGGDVFITKLSSTGTSLVYSTYLGGNGSDLGNRIAIDSSNNAYVTGYTESTNFPTQDPYQAAFAGGTGADVFVTKLSASGNSLSYSTYLGGTLNDIGYGIDIDSSGNIYVGGFTFSSNFPTASFQGAIGGVFDGFVSKLKPPTPPDDPVLISPLNGATVTSLAPQLYALYDHPEAANTGTVEFRVSSGSAADCLNNVNIVSSGASSESSTETGPQFFTTAALTNLATYNWCARNNDGADTSAYATMGSFTVNTTVAEGLVYSSYLGGSGEDRATGIIVDSAGNAYIMG
ncbi:MAG TPA: SBBP repeat-containing protein, partial [Patescibacteria group bacterium]